MNRKLSLAALALACVASPAMAAEVATKGDTAVILPYGDYVVAGLQAIEPATVTAVTALVGISLGKAFPLARAFLTDAVVERAVQKWLDFGINDVAGAMKGKTWSAEIGSSVLASALNRALDRANASKLGAYLLKLAGGPAEAAHKLFRMMNLDEGASGTVLQQVLDDLRAAGHIA